MSDVKTFKPDVKKGTTSAAKLIMLSVGIPIFLISGVAFFYIYYDVNHKTTEDVSVSEMTGGSLPSDFFDQFEENEIIEEVVTPEVELAAPPPTTPKITYQRPALPTPPPKPKLSPESMFSVKIQSKEAERRAAEKTLRDKINLQRINGGGQRMVAVTATDITKSTSRVLNDNYDPNWNRYGVPQDVTSYPVKLERVITVDRMISCILVNEIISDLQGKVTCKVEENIYGAHGRKILIPAHSTGIGFYQPLQKIGDERVAIKWTRIITPEGININTTSAQVADQMGRSGITGDVDNRYTERYGLALLTSAVTSAASYSIPVDNINEQIVVSNMTQDLGSITSTILDEHINIKPRVTINAGTRIFINPTVDIWFPEPKKNSYQVDAEIL